MWACSAGSGVVNTYNWADVEAKVSSSGLGLPHPSPSRAFMNLTTPIDTLRFNSTSEILSMSSLQVKDALRLVHVPSLTVFSNWPTSKTPLHYVSAVDFSPNSGAWHVLVSPVACNVILQRWWPAARVFVVYHVRRLSDCHP